MSEALTLEERAREAYHAYGGVTDWKNYQGLPMPEWPDLTPKIRDAWIAATARIEEIMKAGWTATLLAGQVVEPPPSSDPVVETLPSVSLPPTEPEKGSEE